MKLPTSSSWITHGGSVQHVLNPAHCSLHKLSDSFPQPYRPSSPLLEWHPFFLPHVQRHVHPSYPHPNHCISSVHFRSPCPSSPQVVGAMVKGMFDDTVPLLQWQRSSQCSATACRRSSKRRWEMDHLAGWQRALCVLCNNSGCVYDCQTSRLIGVVAYRCASACQVFSKFLRNLKIERTIWQEQAVKGKCTRGR